MITISRYHDISTGHRVVGHEGKCKNLHGHNYRITFTLAADKLDPIGRVIDFGVVKNGLCSWLEVNWDHRMLIWEEDPMLEPLLLIDNSVERVSFNPTAENIGAHLLYRVGPMILPSYVKLISVTVEETRKCSATVSL